MSDLDLDELRATRILNGTDKKEKKISEEQAIKELTEIKELVEEDLKYKDYEATAILDQIDLESLVIVLNLIEKQSKEIEELENKNEKLYEDNLTLAQELKENNKQKYYHVVKSNELEEEINNAWENKIKAKIEEAKKIYNDLHTKHLRDCGIAEQRELAKIEFGQSLLEKE